MPTTVKENFGCYPEVFLVDDLTPSSPIPFTVKTANLFRPQFRLISVSIVQTSAYYRNPRQD